MAETLQKGSQNSKLVHKLPFQNNLEYILEALQCLDLLIHIQVMKEMARHRQSPLDSFKGIVISDEEILNILHQEAFDVAPTEELAQLMQQLSVKLEAVQTLFKQRREISLEQGIPLRLPLLASRFRLSEFEQLILLICLAPEIDVKYEKLYAYLHDDITRKRPTLDLVLKLLCSTQEEKLLARSRFHSQSPLLQYSLLQMQVDPNDGHSSLLASPLHLEQGIVNYLLESDQFDERIASAARIITHQDSRSRCEFWDAELENRITSFVRDHDKVIFHFHGPYGSQKQSLAEKVCRNLQTPLIIADLKQMLQNSPSFKTILLLLCREAALRSAALCLKNFDCLLSSKSNEISEMNEALERMPECWPHVVFLLGNQSWNREDQRETNPVIDIEFSVPDAASRRLIWDRLRLDYQLEPDIDIGEFAEKYRFTAGRIQDSLIKANMLACWRSPANARINKAELQTACNQQSQHNLDHMASKITPKYTTVDLILPPDQMRRIETIISQMKYRHKVLTEWKFHRKLSYGKGLNVLFCGQPGTGKTMAAEAIAGELGLDLYKLDLSQVISKYIGETEKNLQRLFDEARSSYSILFFDEADALFGKRTEVKDAHDRYANTEVAFLLQKMEEYEGMSILATNLHNNLDDAFIRRIHVRVDFPIPQDEYRDQLWQNMFPPEALRSDDIDFPFLARKFKIAGGNIKNIVLSAAYLAAESSEPISMKHVIPAVKQELEKMGKLCVKDDFGPYYDYIR